MRKAERLRREEAQREEESRGTLSERDAEDFESLKERLQDFNELRQKMVEMQAFAAKTEGWNLVLLKQSTDQEKTIADLQQEIDELVQKECNDAKLQKMVQNQAETIKTQKQDLKALELELSQLKQTWLPPDRQKADSQLMKDL